VITVTDSVSDCDVWNKVHPDDLWIYDKLIVAKKAGHIAGPAGIPVPKAGQYIVRPITNIRMMSRGASIQYLTPTDDSVPDGYFWCEVFTGDHVSVDYHYGQQRTTVQGFRDSDRLDRFCRWTRIDTVILFPKILGELYLRYKWINVEYVGGKIIEIHTRYNDDFCNHSGNTVIPVWKDKPMDKPKGATWYESPSADRLGFWVLDK
jgi:hypothetical protein